MVFLEELSFVLLSAYLTSNIVLAVIGHSIVTPPCIHAHLYVNSHTFHQETQFIPLLA